MNQTKQHSRSRKVACVATLTAAGLSFGLVACGGGGTETEASAASQGSAQTAPQGSVQTAPQNSARMKLTATQRKCLARQGVKVPGNGSSGSSGSPPDQDEMSAAFEACGVDLPEPPTGQGQGDMPQPPSGQPPQGQGSGSMQQPPAGQAS